ncbi:MAG: response regulator [Candidatus Polarisedimenticolaceae bacterium]|nr:response regulator [Candidatus Polarisedimenticolaceae bacterium]
MQEKAFFISISEVFQDLLELSKKGRTGKFYLMTDQSECAIFELTRGEIVDIKYQNIHGTPALPMIRRINSAKCFFKSGTAEEIEKAETAETKLSFNHTLFRMFKLEPSAQRGSANSVENAATSSEPQVEKEQKKILVVEDSRLSRKILTQAIVGYGFQVVEATDGTSALHQLEMESPDLVILDLILPDIDGYEVFKRMKKNKATANIPVIILTSRASLLDKLKGRMSGSDEYLTKPFKNEHLLEKLEKYLK